MRAPPACGVRAPPTTAGTNSCLFFLALVVWKGGSGAAGLVQLFRELCPCPDKFREVWIRSPRSVVLRSSQSSFLPASPNCCLASLTPPFFECLFLARGDVRVAPTVEIWNAYGRAVCISQSAVEDSEQHIPS